MNSTALEYLRITRERLEGLDLGALSFRDVFGDADAEYLLWLLADGRLQIPELAELLPALPSEEVQQNFTGQFGRDGFKQAINAYGLFRRVAEDFGLRPGDGDCRAIDFGCGWGRIGQVMLRDFKPENLVAADVWQEALDHCRETGLPCKLLKVEPWPPMDIETGSIDLIVAYSVFSHLSEDNHWAWLQEFHRVLRPGGVAVLTTRGRSFIKYVATLRKKVELPKHAAGAARVFVDTKEALRKYDRGEYCFDGGGGGGGVLVGFYGEACIPKRYIENRWRTLFSDTRFLYSEDHRLFDQNVVAAKK